MRDTRLDLGAAVLLALCAVATAWSSYQATRWNGEATKASGRTSGLRIQAARAQGLAESQTQVDVATFTQWVDAYAHRDRRLTAFYFARFREEFKPAVEAWIASRPLKNPEAPLTPFATPQYRLAARAESERLETKAAAEAATAGRNIQHATNYVLGVVLFSSALFFAGMGSKLPVARLRLLMVGLAGLIFVGTVIWIATFPVSLAV